MSQDMSTRRDTVTHPKFNPGKHWHVSANAEEVTLGNSDRYVSLCGLSTAPAKKPPRPANSGGTVRRVKKTKCPLCEDMQRREFEIFGEL